MRRATVLIPILAAAAGAAPQVRPPAFLQGSRIAGAWKGTSLCTGVRPQCRDETVVYQVAPGPASGAFTVRMDKVVDGAREWMATLDCGYQPAEARLSCPMPAGRMPGRWDFRVSATEMRGELLAGDGSVIRRISVRRDSLAS